MATLNAALARLSGFATTVLRIVVGGLMAYHGFDKFRGGVDGVEAFFTMVDVPVPVLTAPVVATLELVGGLALVAGIGTRVVASALAAILAGAMVFVKIDVGIIATSGSMPGVELDLALLAGLAALTLLGPGQLALDRMLGLDGARVATG
ncbi:MAG: DoxX family protein [Acidimicrobiales bacterium]